MPRKRLGKGRRPSRGGLSGVHGKGSAGLRRQHEVSARTAPGASVRSAGRLARRVSGHPLAWVLTAAAVLALLAQIFLTPGFLAWGFISGACAAAAAASAIRKLAPMGLTLVSILGSLALAETVVPTLLPSAFSDGTRTEYAPAYWSRGEIGNQANEGRHRTVKQADDGGLIYDVVYSIGRDHFRITPGNGSGPQRVNFLGCSVTFGEGLNDDQTLPYYFAQRQRGVEVQNFAFSGYGPQQALAILQSGRDTHGQVNFFLTAPWHALRSACKPLWTLGSPRYELGPGGAVRRAGSCGQAGSGVGAYVSRALVKSTLYRAVRDVLFSRVNDADIELHVALIREMVAVSHARGQKLVIGFVKADEGFFANTSYSNERIFSELARLADDAIDLTLAARFDAVERRYYLHPLDRHPSAEANRERAKRVSSRLAVFLSDRQPVGAPRAP